MPLAYHPPGCFPCYGKRLGQQLIKGFSLGKSFPEFNSLLCQSSIIQFLDFGFKVVYLIDNRLNFFQNSFIFTAIISITTPG
jgi:hypothetical protein